MAYCAPRGIPYSRFLAWDPLSQDAAIAWSARESQRCGGCGQVRGDWLDDHGVALRQPPFEVLASYCPACDELEKWRSTQGDDGPGPGIAPSFAPAGTAARLAASRQDQG